MATNYAAQNYNVPDGQLSFYNSQQPSPESGSPTPTNTSPTSPRMDTYLKYQLPAQVRQLRPPKSPLYVPAALRPTERVPGKSPMTPPKSLRDSPDSLEQGNYNSRADEESPTVFDLAVQQGLFTDEDLGEVTGPPTKEHWKVRQPDTTSPFVAKTCADGSMYSQMKPPQRATLPNVGHRSTYSSGSTTAGTAATSSAPSIRTTLFLSTKTQNFILTAYNLVPATVAIGNTKSGTMPEAFVTRTPTKRIPTADPALCPDPKA